MKMVYASGTNGAFSLYAAVALMAELTGLREGLFRELAESQPNTLANIEKWCPVFQLTPSVGFLKWKKLQGPMMLMV